MLMIIQLKGKGRETQICVGQLKLRFECNWHFQWSTKCLITGSEITEFSIASLFSLISLNAFLGPNFLFDFLSLRNLVWACVILDSLRNWNNWKGESQPWWEQITKLPIADAFCDTVFLNLTNCSYSSLHIHLHFFKTNCSYSSAGSELKNAKLNTKPKH